MRKLLVVVAFLAVAAIAAGVYFWQRGAGAPGAVTATASGDTNATLAFVPADTPYVFANLEPFPREVSERWMAQMELTSRLWQLQIEQGMHAIEGEHPDAEALKWLRALHAELEGKTMAQVFEHIGYDLQTDFAIYGVGLAPVVRIGLADPEKFRRFIAALEQRAGATVPRGKVGDLEYWQFVSPEAKLRGILALQGQQLVLTMAPPSDENALRTLLGIDPPATTLSDGSKLATLNQEFGYLPYASGYVDVVRVAQQLTAAPTPLETAFLSALGVEKPQFDAVCSTEYAALASAMPRLSMGYTALDPKRMDVVMRMETNAAIAQDLQQLRAPMPGLTQAQNTPLNFGVSLRLAKLPELVNKWAGAVAAAPWQCPQLQELNESFAQGRVQMNNPGVFAAAPVFHGFHAIATRVDVKSLTATPDFAGKLLIGSDNPTALMGMAKSFAPQLASLNLKPDGSVTPLPAMPGLPPNLPAHAAMTEHVLGLAIGAGEEKDLTEWMQVDPNQQPLLVMGYSGELFAAFNTQMLEMAAALQEPAERAKQEEAAKLIGQIYAQIRHAAIRIEFGARGVEWHQTAELN